MAEVKVREHAITEVDGYGIEVSKSLNQDMVFVNDKLAGYLSYTSKKFLPIAGWRDENSPMVCKALMDLKGEEFGEISYVDAPKGIATA